MDLKPSYYFNPHILKPSRYGYAGFGVYIDGDRRGVSLDEIWRNDPELEKLAARQRLPQMMASTTIFMTPIDKS